MSSNFVRFQEILNKAFAQNFICLTQKLANPLKNLALHFLIGITLLRLLEQFIQTMYFQFGPKSQKNFQINVDKRN